MYKVYIKYFRVSHNMHLKYYIIIIHSFKTFIDFKKHFKKSIVLNKIRPLLYVLQCKKITEVQSVDLVHSGTGTGSGVLPWGAGLSQMEGGWRGENAGEGGSDYSEPRGQAWEIFLTALWFSFGFWPTVRPSLLLMPTLSVACFKTVNARGARGCHVMLVTSTL